MKARDVMTTDVVSVPPDMAAKEIAKLLLEKAISAVPVVDESGAPVGMVSEGDLIGRDESARQARRDWWLALLAEGETFNAEFLADTEQTARDIMSSPVLTVGEETDVGEIARLLAAYRIKRVPALSEGRIVGIVSRADLLRVLAADPAPPATPPTAGLFASAIAGLDEHFLHWTPPEPTANALPAQRPASDRLAVADFHRLVTDFERREAEHRQEVRRVAAVEHKHRVAELIDQHISDEGWRDLLHRAREAAKHGQREFMLMRFPSQLCSDGGRAINVPAPDWPAALRGAPAELYLRWERELKPVGFHLVARVLEFTEGKLGDIGLFLLWGQ
jgi:CBS domain-containing protein